MSKMHNSYWVISRLRRTPLPTSNQCPSYSTSTLSPPMGPLNLPLPSTMPHQQVQDRIWHVRHNKKNTVLTPAAIWTATDYWWHCKFTVTNSSSPFPDPSSENCSQKDTRFVKSSVIISCNHLLPPSLVPKDRVGPWLVLAVSVAAGALVAAVAAVEDNVPKLTPGTSSTRKRKRRTFHYRDSVVSTDNSTSQVWSSKSIKKPHNNTQCNKYSTFSRKRTRANTLLTSKDFQQWFLHRWTSPSSQRQPPSPWGLSPSPTSK